MRKRWKLHKHERETIANLARELKIAPLVAALLISRGQREASAARKFLNPSFEHLHEPNLLKDLPRAVERILRAIEQNEKILIWGDYDVDGTTGTVVLRKALKLLGAKTDFHVPNRFTEGYGLNIPALEKAKSDGFRLVLTVDCGSTAFEPIAWAKENGVEVIVTDHHLTKDKNLPKAYAIINPNQPECSYPDKNLAGVGVAFKLAHALLRARGKENLVKGFLKIVAIGTIADIMSLQGENRAIVSLGLRDLPQAKNYGLRALMETARISGETNAFDIGFRIAPRINAAGRMDAGRAVVELFETENLEKARALAEHLDKLNRERQTAQKQITDFAESEFYENGGESLSPYFAVIAGENWHRGVIGLAAARLAEKLHRPAIVISLENKIGHGSGRSIKPYHLLKGLDSCASLFEQYGGHAQAAGIKIKAENIDELRRQLNKHCGECLTAEDFIPELEIDALVTTSSLSLDLAHQLKQLEPFGAGNPKPRLLTKNLVLSGEPRVLKERHLKLFFADEQKRLLEAVWWNGFEAAQKLNLRPNGKLNAVYTLEINAWNKNAKLQMVIEDLRESE
jgi:single-stranded-DNA-specific exonuclease